VPLTDAPVGFGQAASLPRLTSAKQKGGPKAAPSLARSTILRLARLGCVPLAQGAEARAPQITGRLFQVLAFKCLSVYHLTIWPFDYLNPAVSAAL
jgi:hypothetical protein